MTRFFPLLLALIIAACAQQAAQVVQEPASYTVASKVVTLPSDRRSSIPVSVYYPQGATGPLPVVLFSTGAFSSPEKYEALLKPWAQAGFAILAPLHVDSERWEGPRPAARSEGLAWRRLDFLAAAGAESMIEQSIGADLDLSRVVAAGHSFGGLIAQVLGGAQPGPMAGTVGRGTPFEVVALLAVSPPGPIPTYIEADGWAMMSAPQLLTTGTADIVPQMAPQWDAHLGGHRAHLGESWALVQADVDHYFGNVIGRTEYPGPAQQAQFDEMVIISTDFITAYLRGSDQAMARFKAAPKGTFSPDSQPALLRR
ncbi:MAG: hypothetical protein AAF337_04225 [Pseudomonadota bacterium]